MSELVTELRVPRDVRVALGAISPELALVDPTLAEEARALLPESRSFVGGGGGAPVVRQSDEHAQFRTLANAALDVRGADSSGRHADRSRRLLGAVAASTILLVLLLDVQVELGRTPAAAESVRSMQSATAEPSAPKSSHPSRAAKSRAPSARRFAWAPVASADAYRVELFRGDERVFSASTTRSQLVVPAVWTYRGGKHSLTSGEYRWYVWAIDSGKRASNAIVQARLAVP